MFIRKVVLFIIFFEGDGVEGYMLALFLELLDCFILRGGAVIRNIGFILFFVIGR